MVDSQRRNNSLMKRNLKAITGLCFGGQEPQPSTTEDTPQQSHRPDKEPAGSSAGAERLPSTHTARSLCSDRARAKLGRYVATEHERGLVAT
ncbi:hypothetical protein F2Q68_00035219 [Brassica cretica]|uniref:Uncharacterized protein n=1 Tax=Brassica cretica TaxID=69181 RepID=A0A8S9H8V8_BRACR|nr:hypothetical protein F2Q68_00035219 [Brassica cretica]